MFQADTIIRKNILALKPYSSARSEFKGSASIFLDANENNLGSAAGNYNRYPDPLQASLKRKVGELKGIAPEHIFLGNGSDEAIDLLIRATCDPGTDNIIVTVPGYGMYEVSAGINNTEIRKVLLDEAFQPDVPAILQAADAQSKLLFLCSPNNPTGNLIDPDIVSELLQAFNGLVVLDEAYIDFAPGSSWLPALSRYPNLVILQTFSKAWGMAGVRLGMAFASPVLIDVLNKIKPPYNISQPVSDIAIRALDQRSVAVNWVQQINAERARISTALKGYCFVSTVFPSSANFLLVRVSDAGHLYRYLLTKGIVVRNRHGVPLCDQCLRISIGTPEENDLLLLALNQYPS